MGKYSAGNHKVADKIFRTKHSVKVGQDANRANVQESWVRPSSKFHVGGSKTSFTNVDPTTGKGYTKTHQVKGALTETGRKTRNYTLIGVGGGAYAEGIRRDSKSRRVKKSADPFAVEKLFQFNPSQAPSMNKNTAFAGGAGNKLKRAGAPAKSPAFKGGFKQASSGISGKKPGVAKPGAGNTFGGSSGGSGGSVAASQFTQRLGIQKNSSLSAFGVDHA